ncbi:L-seryl-tRNA(Ser) seleniumtransferase/D-glucosaminate-6-phosphate ammonia-lyase [Sporomusaceae bacterium BoRhaA]|uniref:DgaE family pyridoxal phosphate-dependent ammonia lyase n=1 Tax=Pelorhabdus rhamnosifermentans TaxID=2772457 RepID=UPI001C0624BC|nr:DgaE family pyridoxal phosphate-dependent ammonia lyase [Pelorhabdus rhamnosifermentans]MBU2702738.1 L-seryl-tRNA(Ser) seleniumtransferase/D-glucosaminate-6-phosphate ammonia-lyase [Pelorhabdus rhamnosifermentans]
MNIYESVGLRKVINASGKMTILGVSTLADEVSTAIYQASKNYVVMEELMVRAGELISKYTGAEGSCVTLGAASAIAIATAATITKGKLTLVEKMPHSQGLKNEIILQKGHAVNFGASVIQMIQLGGGQVVEVGQANQVSVDHIKENINENTAALLYVKSHHAIQKGMVSLGNMIRIAQENNLPIIVDAAAEEDLRKYVAMGADMVIYSGAKSIEGPTSGFITGKERWICACSQQYKGIARAMKVGKESMIGLLKALELYEKKDVKVLAEKQKQIVNYLQAEMNKLNGLSAVVEQDEAGREIYRLKVKVDEKVLGINALEFIHALESGNPAVYTRNYYANLGYIHFDPRPLQTGEEKIILDRVAQISRSPR